MSRLRPLFWPAILTILVGSLLIGLGVWQLHRLAWKEAILDRIASRTHAPAVPLPPRSAWPTIKAADYAYRKVTLSGTFMNDKEALVFRGTDAGPGYFVVTPLALDGGGTVLVNRGFVPSDLKDRAARSAGEAEGHVMVTGLMREPETRNLFTPADEPEKGIFFTKDAVLIATHDGLSDAAPFLIDADASPNPGGWPRGGTTAVDIPNNHFSYAMTWFGLALGLIVVFCNFAWKRLHVDPQAGDVHHDRSPSTAAREAHHHS